MFSAAEKIRHEQLRTVEDERKAKKESDTEEEEEEEGKDDDFHSPRQSFFTQQPLVRPSIRKMPTAEKVEDQQFYMRRVQGDQTVLETIVTRNLIMEDVLDIIVKRELERSEDEDPRSARSRVVA